MTLDIKKGYIGKSTDTRWKTLKLPLAQVIFNIANVMLPKCKIMKYTRYQGRVYWEINKHYVKDP